MPDVVARNALDLAKTQRQDRLRSFQCLNLAFLVDAQHHSVVRRIQVEADDVSDLLDEKGVVGQLEVFLPMRL